MYISETFINDFFLKKLILLFIYLLIYLNFIYY